MLTNLTGDLIQWGVTAIGAIAALVGVYFFGKRGGKAQVETKVAQEQAKEAVAKAEQVTIIAKETQNVETNVAAKSDDAVIGELRDKWTRD